MGLTTVEALCECNGSTTPSHQTVECYISAKDLLPSCKPILRKSACGFRRMVISTLVLFLFLAVIYLVSVNGHRIKKLHEVLRNRRQVAPREIAPLETSTPEETIAEDEVTATEDEVTVAEVEETVAEDEKTDAGDAQQD
ncbi:unnamed protein product [Xylocopa violacea]|uniref:Uncharacterized protein n=1 Tax=Xylocopa violacea TaxID=135666 RepID=A0ABP1NXT7_XYLVO